ncbi:IS110 family transposase [Pseudonocardia charpentierae]|uniref:IS110 family transposase n=1 Tax=Pseudonocardia charpentierae TaxID=3075545 RepID=UPI0037C83E33
MLARVGDVHRFRSAAAFASYTGTAPIELSSGDVVRHRLSRTGDRQLNCCLHTMAITQLHATARAAPTTCANEPTGRATKKPCAASSGGCPTWSTGA